MRSTKKNAVKTALLTAVCALVLAGNANAQARPKLSMMNDIKNAASYVLGATPDYLNSDNCDSRCIDGFLAQIETGLVAIKDAVATGVEAGTTVEVVNNRRLPKKDYSLQEIEAQLSELHKVCRRKHLSEKITQTAMRVDKWLPEIHSGKLGEVEAKMVKDEGKGLIKLLDESGKANISDLIVETFVGKYNMAELRTLAVYASNAASKQLAAIIAKREAFDKPFIDGLAGDRRKIFQSEFAGNEGSWAAFGAGMRALTSVGDLKGAAVWFTWGFDNRGIVAVWHITGYHFSGDTLVRRSSKSGIGVKPSPGAFN
jgi:hypothetical protein